MTSSIRSLLSHKVLKAFAKTPQATATATATSSSSSSIKYSNLLPLIKINPKDSSINISHSEKDANNNSSESVRNNNNVSITGCGHPHGWLGCSLSLKKLLQKFQEMQHVKRCELDELGSQLLQQLDIDETVLSAHLEPNNKDRDINLKFKVSGAEYFTSILHSVLANPSSYWRSSELLATLPKQTVVLEYSSPNIAKPFHVGHLRSTILGHCLARLHEALGHNVTRINYLGDWGTQFGMLKYGFDAKGLSKSDLESDAIRKLYDVYVWANKQAETDESVNTTAKEIFAAMERGEQEHLDIWRFFRDISVRDLEKMYGRLGISFDEYHGESMYTSNNCQEVLREMRQQQLLERADDGREMYSYGEDNKKRRVTVVKSDGSCLYLTRDIAAAVQRYHRYKFERHYYIVDHSQTDHFSALFSALTDLGYDWAVNMKHIKFGRIKGLSSRRGNAAFLSDLLDDGQEKMIENQTLSYSTRVSGAEATAAADTVALSALVVADLKTSRHKDYNFSWDVALQNKGNTGVALQYTHCRLVQLESSSGTRLNSTADAATLTQHPTAINLIVHIAKFDEVLYQFQASLEPCVLVAYLFHLNSSIKAALNELSVREAGSTAESEDRLLLFVAARHTIAAGLHILGLTPLQRM